jgi:carboxypeptidase Q
MTGRRPRGRGPEPPPPRLRRVSPKRSEGGRAALLALVVLLSCHVRADSWIDEYRAPATRLINEATRDHFAWNRLSVLTDTIGPRLSGSPQLDRAVTWAVAEMTRDGLENVHAENVMVPKWVRGNESAEIVRPSRQPLAMLGLGDSVGTPPAGIEAGVVIVHGFEELEAQASQLRGKIVLINGAFTNYAESSRYRRAGAARAARHGAVAVLVRSIAPDGLRLPHTGALDYAAGVPRIPGAALSTEDADLLERLVARGEKVVVRLKMGAHAEPDVESANVIGELRGRERPDEVVVVSGHLDSWDVGTGATDDGGGCIVAWEALRVMKKLGLRPRRTVRVVLWTNEENGGRGGIAYRDRHRAELGNHVAMIESDNGVFRPLGFGVNASEAARQTLATIASLLAPVGASEIVRGGDGADITPSTREAHIPALSLEVDNSRYFLIHHTQADTVDKIDPADMARCAAAMTVMAYVIADAPVRLAQ